MLRVIGCISQSHDLKLALIALVIGTIGCLTTVALLARARHAPASLQGLWIAAAACEFGSAVWAKHFLAMLAYHSGFPITYGLAWSALSILLIVLLSALGFAVAVKTSFQAGAGAMIGVAIVAMHYVSMGAMVGPFQLHWNMELVVASGIAGCLLASTAFGVKALFPSRLGKLVKAGLLSSAVAAVHYIGMTAITLAPAPSATTEKSILESSALAVAVGAAALFVVTLGLISAYLDLYLERRKLSENERLKGYVAELEAAKLELGVALETAYSANKSKSAFLAAMSHELRTPLNAIIGFSDLMANEAFGDLGNSRYKSYSEDIHKSGTHLLSLINDILDISRLEANKAELHEAEINVSGLLEDTVRLVDHLAQTAGVQIKLVCESNLPALWADERRVKQIVINLLSNSIKFTPPGGSITIGAALTCDHLEIQVRDTGIGIASENIPQAFESFRQIDNRLARKYEGSGLGLPLARHLAELHAGSLDLTSALGAGTTATVRFPAFRCQPARMQAA